MVKSSSFYTRLATRDGFNTYVRHINRTLDLLDSCGSKNNVADEINKLLSDKALESEEVQSVVNMLLVEKWGYSVVSKNLASIVSHTESVAEECSKWKAVDLVVGYHHPDLGFIVFNPKNPENAAVISGFRKNELVILYAGTREKDAAATAKAKAALSTLLDLLEDRAVKTPSSLIAGSYVFVLPKKVSAKKAAPVKTKPSRAPARSTVRASFGSAIYTGPVQAPAQAQEPVQQAAPAPAPAPAAHGQSKMSALNSIVVTNELFHNGNVEAWKRIIRSFNAKYPNLQVFIYYDGERIVDINTLFKWGKVKHGSCIQYTVAGENIQDLAKLSRYFRQGASSQFEAFLHGSPDTVMNLF